MGITATFFWRIFEETGSIDAYLAYRKVYSGHGDHGEIQPDERSEKNYIS